MQTGKANGQFVARNVEERFWEKVQKTDTCWFWTSMIDAWGYGRFKVKVGPGKYRNQMAHRIAYEWLVGPIPEGLSIDHLCRVPHCVNPAHMEAVPIGVNVNRGNPSWKQKARRTHCNQGHPYDEANTYRFKNTRQCRKCNAANAVKRRAARRG